MRKIFILIFCFSVLAACSGGGSGAVSVDGGSSAVTGGSGSGGTSQPTTNPATVAAPVTKITYINSDAASASSSDKLATVRFLLTDAPNDQIDSAVVTINDMTVHKTGGAFFSVLQGERTLDLMDLQNGVTALLGEAELEPGMYTQIRFAVAGGSVVSGGETYGVDVPSDTIKLNRNIDVCSGGSLEIVLDFDARESLKYNKGQKLYKMNPVVKIASVTADCPDDTGGAGGEEEEESTYTGPTGWLSIVIPPLPVDNITYSLRTTVDDIWVHDQGLGQLGIFTESYAADLLDPGRQSADEAGGPLYTVLVPPVKVPATTLDQVRLLIQPIVATDGEGRSVTIKLPPDQDAESSGLKFFGSVKVCEDALTVLQWDLDLSPGAVSFGSTDAVITLHPEIHGVNLRAVCVPYSE